MKSIRKILVVGCILLGVVSLLGYLGVSYAGAYRVSFMGETLTMTPAQARTGETVTFTFSVNNEGERISNVLIRVIMPCDSRGRGLTLCDLRGQVINPGVNNYSVTGRFGNPMGARNGVLIELFDLTVPPPIGSTLDPVRITHSGYRGFAVIPHYGLKRYEPLY